MKKIPIFKSLKIPLQNLEQMIQGQSIIALPQVFITPGQQFALYPDQANSDSELVLIKFWARCEFCQIIDDPSSFDTLALLSMRSSGELHDIFERKGALFLAYLRVYSLANSVELPANQNNQFINLPETVYVSDDSPVLSDRDFARLKRQIENLEPPEPLDVQIERMLKEAEIDHKASLEQELAWIKTISTLGDRSIEQDQGKSNYHAGTDFENIVKKSLEFLGFTVDYAHKGGAGGLDLLCLKPYALFGECKAGKKIPNDTAVQLLNLGTLRRRELFLEAVKLIIGAGEATNQLNEAAQVHHMAIINSNTLQKLVELNAQYSGSVDLVKLRNHLVAGQSDEEIGKYINEVKSEIKLRSHIISLVRKANRQVGIDYLSGVYDSSEYPKPLNNNELYEILIELSSPLAGYLGRQKGNGWESDRFYFLRDLPI